MSIENFGTRLAKAVLRTGTPLCMGIDPHTSMMPSLFGDVSETASPATLRAIEDFTMACLAAAKGRVAAIKPQAAFFEAQGFEGMRILAQLGRAAIDAGMLVIMDGKRNDIGSTNAAYAEAWIGHDAAFPSDALTVNAYLGLDTLEPLLERADSRGAGLFVLTRTSNPGAGDLQDLDVDGTPFSIIWPAAWRRWPQRAKASRPVVAGHRRRRHLARGGPRAAPDPALRTVSCSRVRRAGSRPGAGACRAGARQPWLGRRPDQFHPRPDFPGGGGAGHHQRAMAGCH